MKKKWLALGFLTVFIHAMDAATTIYLKERYPKTRELNPLFRKLIEEKKWGILLFIKIFLAPIFVFLCDIWELFPFRKNKEELCKHEKKVFRAHIFFNFIALLPVINNAFVLFRERQIEKEGKRHGS